MAVSSAELALTVGAAEALRRAHGATRPATPAALAARLIPCYNVTPAIRMISDVLADAITQPGRRIIITTPPRTGKSVLISQIGVVFALMDNPDAKVILASYADSLAEEHSREARRMITENANLLGFTLAADKQAVGRWRVAGHAGGLLATGIMSGVTGHGSSLLLIDDPIKNRTEADSPAFKQRLLNEYRSTLATRLHPGASVVLVMTRWAPDDLAGVLLAEEPDKWQVVNIPAVAETGIPDALDRTPGAAMVSALGRTAEEFAELRSMVGERAWFSMFQGVPAPPDGGLIHQEWFDRWRLPAEPERPMRTVVAVDPADSGHGDAAGIIAASLTGDGVVVIHRDISKPMTSEQWAKAAVEMALDVGASKILVEGFSAATTYRAVVRDALRRSTTDRPIQVTSWPPKGAGRTGDALARSAGLIQGLEVGTCRIAGQLFEFERAATQWHAGQHQPDALAAAVIAFDTLSRSVGQRMTFGSPLAAERRAGAGKVTPISRSLARRLEWPDGRTSWAAR
ncbi:terminase family protein [Nocardia sp. NPDC049190]|uniref:terminase large subunit domain-containing protein n=1 Tax=Nocardia sp. NPDC049190 TaxID=3155650 RepID=UPI00340180A6